MVNMGDIRPIQTSYKGYKFRSRLEARWGVFFDVLRVRWAYEPQGFELGPGSCYLPDFWVAIRPEDQSPYPQGSPPERGFWVEIKSVDPLLDEPKHDCKIEMNALLPEEMWRCAWLARDTGHCVYLIAGNVGRNEFVSYKWHPEHCNEFAFLSKYETSGYVSGNTYISLNSFVYYMVTQCADYSGGTSIPVGRVESAFQAARSARFEHGESPHV
jgi:hypothetical protein